MYLKGCLSEVPEFNVINYINHNMNICKVQNVSIPYGSILIQASMNSGPEDPHSIYEGQQA